MEQEPNFAKGFNDGYKMRSYNPEMFELLKPTLREDIPYQQGILEGAQQAEKEIEQKRLVELESLRSEQTEEQEIEK